MDRVRNFLKKPLGIIALFIGYIFVFSILFHLFGAHFQHGSGTSHIEREYAEDIAMQVCEQIAGSCELSRDWASKSINDYILQNPEKNFVVALEYGGGSIRYTIVGQMTVPGCVQSSQPSVTIDTDGYYALAEKASEVRVRFCTSDHGEAVERVKNFAVSDVIQKYVELRKHDVVRDLWSPSAWIKYFAFSVNATTSLGWGDVVSSNSFAEAGVSLFTLVGAIFWAFIIAAITRAMGSRPGDDRN